MCTSTIAKYFLCVFNLAFFLVGGAMLGVGLWMNFDTSGSYMIIFQISNVASGDQILNLLSNSIYVIIAVGALIFVFGFFGCCGAYRENKICLLIYAVLVGVVVILQIAGGIMAGVYKDQAVPEMKTKLKAFIQSDYTGNWDGNAASLLIESIQIQLQCCGIDSYTDLQTATNWNRGSNVIPPSCCFISNKASVPPENPNPVNSSCTEYPNTSNSFYTNSCTAQLTSYIDQYGTIILGCAIGLVALELICIGAAIYLKNQGEKAI